MSESCPLYLVDAFTSKPFSGNPAGVFFHSSEMTPKQMQLIASEVNASGTAFPVPLDAPPFEVASRFHLQWFSPQVDVPLCGHATLATAHVLFCEMKNQNRILRFETQSGELVVRREGDYYAMDFPAGIAEPIETDVSVYDALGIQESSVLDTQYCDSPNKLLVVVDEEHVVRGLAPDFLRLREVSRKYNACSVVVTCRSASPDYDCVSRNFAPIRGVNEDPVTGSSHVILCPYWQERLHRSQLKGFQASPRGGVVIVEAVDDSRVVLKGTALTISRGQMLVPSDR
jgi:PhzF family phenazine biosynthesis protein